MQTKPGTFVFVGWRLMHLRKTKFMVHRNKSIDLSKPGNFHLENNDPRFLISHLCHVKTEGVYDVYIVEPGIIIRVHKFPGSMPEYSNTGLNYEKKWMR